MSFQSSLAYFGSHRKRAFGNGRCSSWRCRTLEETFILIGADTSWFDISLQDFASPTGIDTQLCNFAWHCISTKDNDRFDLLRSKMDWSPDSSSSKALREDANQLWNLLCQARLSRRNSQRVCFARARRYPFLNKAKGWSGDILNAPLIDIWVLSDDFERAQLLIPALLRKRSIFI